MQPTKHIDDQRGFTVVELSLASILSIVVVTIFISILVSTLFVVGRNKVQLELNSSSQSALDTIERDIRFSTDFTTTVDTATFTDPYQPSGGWSFEGNPSSSTLRNLILKAYATNASTLSSTRQNIYQNTAEFGCASDRYNLNPPLPYSVVYFVSSGTLYRRTLTNTALAVCNNNGTQAQKLSCPRDIATPPAACKAFDEIISTDVTSFTVSYYTDSADTVAKTVYGTGDSQVLSDCVIAVVNLTTQRNANSKPVSSTMTLRANRLNTN